MRLSPVEDPFRGKSWLADADLYGRHAPNPGRNYSFEVFPVREDDDTTGLQPVPLKTNNLEPQKLGFDIEQANKGIEYKSVAEWYNRPRVIWCSREEFKNRFRYDPLNPPRPRGITPRDWEDYAEDFVRGRFEPTITLTPDRRELLRRITTLWNGNTVCDAHLLADRCPPISQLTSDLNEDDLNRLFYNTEFHRDFVLAFKDAQWFDIEMGALKPQTLFRKQVWYDLTEKGRTLLNNHHSFPGLKGDPHEGLVHRVTVGLVRLHDELRGWNTTSYHPWSNYVLDVFGRDSNQHPVVQEVVTGHHNSTLHRQTYRKLAALNDRGVKPIVVFDSRDTAYSVFNHWHNAGLAELPNGTFDSDYSIDKGRGYIEDAYESDSHEWAVADWTTTWVLKRKTLGADGPDLSHEQIVSLDW